MTPKQQLIEALRALCHREGGADAVADAIGVNDQTLKQVLAGTKLPSGEPRGVGPAVQRKLETRYPGWAHLLAESTAHQTGGVAQQVSHHPKRVETNRLSWEQLVSGAETGELFATAIPDNANAPDYPAGLEVIWSTTKQPQIGSLVLVRDRHGQLHAREYRQGKAPGHWLAAPSNRAFRTFDSGADGLQVVAVAAYKGLP